MTSRFAIAVHVLGMLASLEGCGGNPVTSIAMAESIGTNPVVVRRVLSALRQAGLVTTQRGVGGGARLARPADQITLRDIYEALEDREVLFHTPPGFPNPACTLGPQIAGFLSGLFEDLEETLKGRLGDFTVADVRGAVVGHAA